MSDYRVTVKSKTGEILAMEMFTSDGDAEVYMTELLKDEDKILEALDDKVVTVAKEELYKGTWVVLNKKLVRI